jgi:hypothetical protein
MFTPDQGHVLLDYLEEKGRRVAVLDGKPAERNDALNRENAAERTNRRGFLGSLILGRTRRTGST